jgi:hypothetical protein
MSNCDVGSGGFRLPCDIVTQHGVEDCDHLTHDGDDNDFGFLVGCSMAVAQRGGRLPRARSRRPCSVSIFSVPAH